MNLVRITDPATEPLTLAEAKLHLRVESDVTADDTLITSLITAARGWVEAQTHRALITQSWRYALDAFPCGDTIDLPVPNLISVDTFTYVDTAGATQTVSSTIYSIDKDHLPGRIVLGYSRYWPYTQPIRNAVTVEFTAGYGAATVVPDELKAAIKLVIGDLYENREAQSLGAFTYQPNRSVLSLIAPFRFLEAS